MNTYHFNDVLTISRDNEVIGTIRVSEIRNVWRSGADVDVHFRPHGERLTIHCGTPEAASTLVARFARAMEQDK